MANDVIFDKRCYAFGVNDVAFASEVALRALRGNSIHDVKHQFMAKPIHDNGVINSLKLPASILFIKTQKDYSFE